VRKYFRVNSTQKGFFYVSSSDDDNDLRNNIKARISRTVFVQGSISTSSLSQYDKRRSSSWCVRCFVWHSQFPLEHFHDVFVCIETTHQLQTRKPRNISTDFQLSSRRRDTSHAHDLHRSLRSTTGNKLTHDCKVTIF
jgi:hypothetical protein